MTHVLQFYLYFILRVVIVNPYHKKINSKTSAKNNLIL